MLIIGLNLLFTLISAQATEKSKTPHATIVVRPGPPVEPTQAAKPVGNLKSDWGEKQKR